MDLLVFQTESKLIKKFPPYVFAKINAAKLAARQKGIDVIDLGMGNPDGGTPIPVVNKLIEVIQGKKSHGYSASKGIFSFLKAISRWYERKYQVQIDPKTEAVSVIGSKEGLAHLGLAIWNPGDQVLAPDPTYPIHHYSVVIANGKLISVSLGESPEKFLVNLYRISSKPGVNPKALIINFPHNPTTLCAEQNFFKDIVTWAKKRQVLVIHDFAYADITFDGFKAPSFLATPGAKDIGIEFFTLSKSYNMAGWRVGFAAGNAKVIASLAKLKSYMDYGIFTPIQVAAIAALDRPEVELTERAKIYEERRDIFYKGLMNINWPVPKPKGSMYIWAPIPSKYEKMSAVDFSMLLLEKSAVAVSPGTGFGKLGEGYIRFALVENKSRIRQALRNLKKIF